MTHVKSPRRGARLTNSACSPATQRRATVGEEERETALGKDSWGELLEGECAESRAIFLCLNKTTRTKKMQERPPILRPVQ